MWTMIKILCSLLYTHVCATWTVSRMPMITVSTGNVFVSGVKRALEPCVMSTSSPSPAPTVSTATSTRPVVTRLPRVVGSRR